jgi:hypothetical protein
LADNDGCTYTPFDVFIKAPARPAMSYTITKYPTSACATDGVAIITYMDGGVPPYLYQNKSLNVKNDKITVTGLKYGNNEIQFTDADGYESEKYNIPIAGGANITDVTAGAQTCDPPNGRIKITVTGLSGEKTYRIVNTATSEERTKDTATDSYEFEGLIAGEYTVSVLKDGCLVEKEGTDEVASQLFKITDPAVTHATTLEGTGSATVTFANLNGGTATWLNNGDTYFNSIHQGTVTTRSGGIPPGTYALAVRHSTGCTVTTGMTIEKPAFWGDINLYYTEDSLRITSNNLSGNPLFAPYTFRVFNAGGELIMENKKPEAGIREPGTYTLYACHTQGKDSSLLHDFAFPARPIQAPVAVSPPVCPDAKGTVTVNIEGGSFGHPSAVSVSMDGQQYTAARTFILDAAEYNVWLQDTEVKQVANQDVSIHSVLTQPFSFVIPAVSPVGAEVKYASPLCAGSTDGWIALSDFTGGYGEYEYKIDNGAWKDAADTTHDLSSGTYYIYLRDKTYECAAQELVSATLRAPAGLNISITAVEHTTCELDNGMLAAQASGGAPPYTYTIRSTSSSYTREQGPTTGTVSFTGLQGAQQYEIAVKDANGCSAIATLQGINNYVNPLISGAAVTDVSCHGGTNGKISVSVTKGTSSDLTVMLYTPDYSFQQNETSGVFADLRAGSYQIDVCDNNGCRANATFPVTVTAPAAALTATTSAITDVLCNGEATGALEYVLSGGTPPYRIELSGATMREQSDAGASCTFANLPAGAYTAKVTDHNACIYTVSAATIQQPPKLMLSYTSATHTTCESDNGILAAQASGGVAPYTYKLSVLGGSYTQVQTLSAADTAFFSHLAGAMEYQLEITDSYGCTINCQERIHGYKNPLISAATVTAVSCFGENNGTVEVSLMQGDAPVQTVYLYTPDHSFEQSRLPGIFEGLHPGNYLADVYDENGCKSNDSYPVSVKEPALLHVTVDTIVPVINKGARSGKINFKVQGGNAGNKTIVLQRHDVIVDQFSGISNVPLSFTQYAGTYVLQVTDARGCRFTTSALPVEEPADSLRLMIKEVQDALCKSQAGRITVEGVGGWGGYRYKRASNPSFASLNTFDKLYPGDYVITVTDRLGGVYSETITIHEPKDSLRAVVTAQELPACGNNGALSIHIAGGTPPYTLYENADTTFYVHPQQVRLADKSSGDYLFHLVDNNGCRFELETQLSAAALLTVEDLTVQHPGFPASSDGSVTAIVHGGTEPYTYRWTKDITLSLPENAPTLTGVAAGYYGVEVTDAKGCTVQAAAMLLNPSDASFMLVDAGHETSFGAANGYAILYADVSLSEYELITPTLSKHVYTHTDSTAIFHTRNDTVFLHGLSGGQWILSGRNTKGQDCVLELVIHPYREFSIANVAVMHAHRPGDSTGQARIDVQGGGGNNRFTWEKRLPAFPEERWSDTHILSEEDGSLLHNVPAGLYVVYVEDRYGNILQKEINIEEPAQALAVSIGSYQDQSCKTYRDAYVELSAGGGWGDYQFRHSTEQYFSNSAIFQHLETGTHNFYVIDSYGILDSVQFRISEPDYLHTSVAFVDSITCKDAADGRILFNLSGGTAPYFLSELNSQIWRESAMAGNMPEGYHTFVFTDKNTCAGLDTLTVYVPEPDSLLFKDITVVHTTCGEDNGKIAVGMQGGTWPYNYRWEDFNSAVIGDDTLISGLQKNALYNLTVTDRNGCVQQLTQRINSSTLPAITGLQTTPVLCYGDTTGTALITTVSPAAPYAPYNLVWSNSDKGNFSGKFHAGTHSVTLTDTNGCVTARYFSIAQPEPLTIIATQVKEPNCYGFNDGTIQTRSAGGVGGYSYEWSTGAITPDVERLVRGDYHVKLTDANGCTTTQVFTISQPDAVALIVKEVKTPDCYGYTNGYILTEGRGGVGGYKYNWSTGAVSSNIVSLAAGDYKLELQDANGCTIDSTFILTQPDSLTLTAGIKEPGCYGFNDGYIITEGRGGVGGYTYNWSTGATTPDIKELVKGNYSLVFSDANGCSFMRYFDIAQPDALQLVATDIRDPHCFGYNDGHIFTETTGGVREYTYEWSTGAATPDVEHLVKGNYHVLLTDAHGCTYQKSFTLEEPPYQRVDLGQDVIMCPGNTHLLDGGDYAAYRWYTAGGDIFHERYLQVTDGGQYFLEATDTRDCPAWGEVRVAIGDNALTADFLLPSEAPLGDTVIAIELSNLPLDSLRWNYDQQIFERLWPDNEYNQPYILHLRGLQTGVYNVTLYAYTGGCYAYATKQIEITEPGASGTQPAWGYEESLITSLELFPNPTGGSFNVVISLREIADVTLTLFEVASGSPANVRTERGMDYYYLTYDIPQLNSGFYVLIVTAGKERRQVTIVVEK